MIAHARNLSETVDKSYEHHQDVAASTWIINHNLGKKPSVRVADSANNDWEGEIVYVNLNQLTITFTAGGVPASFGGIAYLN